MRIAHCSILVLAVLALFLTGMEAGMGDKGKGSGALWAILAAMMSQKHHGHHIVPIPIPIPMSHGGGGKKIIPYPVPHHTHSFQHYTSHTGHGHHGHGGHGGHGGHYWG